MTFDQFAVLLSLVGDPVHGDKVRTKLLLWARKTCAVQEHLILNKGLIDEVRQEVDEELASLLYDLWVGTSTIDGT